MDKIKYDKPRLSIEKHITSLQQKGLLIKNVAYAQHILQNVSYYRLSGYFHHFYDMNNPNKFIKNISFEHIIELYDFDKRLRLLILEAIEHIEISWRTIIADVISKKDIFAFNSMDIYHHKDTTYTQFQTNRFKNWNRCTENFKKHTTEKYKYPPVWIEVETWSMGTIRDCINALTMAYLLQIIENTNIKTHSLLLGWVKNLTSLRNVCAHHSRLWNKQLNNIDASNRGLGDLHNIFKTTHNQQRNEINKNPNNRVYYYCLVIWYLLQHINPQSKWNKRVSDLMDTLPTHIPHVGLINMGFTKGWQKHSFWGLK